MLKLILLILIGPLSNVWITPVVSQSGNKNTEPLKSFFFDNEKEL
jgi:hypothetical protein